MQVDLGTVQYATFWERLLASLLDSIVQLCIFVPLAYLVFGGAMLDPNFDAGIAGIFINWVLPALYVLLFWKYKSATPGKIWMGIVIVDANTGATPDMGKLILRYVGYFVCVLTLFIGFLMVLFDSRKRGLHDIIAGTLVIKTPPAGHYMDR